MESTAPVRIIDEGAMTPDQVLRAGVAPIADAVNTFGEREYQNSRIRQQQQFEMAAAQRAQQNAALLQQLRLDSTAKNVAARDAMLLQRAHEADMARVAVGASRDKQHADAVNNQALNQAIKEQYNLASKYGTKIPPLVGSGPNGIAVTQDYQKHLNDLTAANDAQRTGKIGDTAKNIVNAWHERDQVQSQTAAYVAQNGRQAAALAAAKNPVDQWIAQLPPNSKQVLDYNATIQSGGSIGDALKASGLASQYGQFLKDVTPQYAAELVKLNASNDPAAKALYQRAAANEIQIQQLTQDKKGQPVDYAPEAQQLALSLYGRQLGDSVKAIQGGVAGAGGDPNSHPIVQNAANAALQKIQDKQKIITVGGSAGGSNINTTPPVVSPAINPLVALKTGSGLPLPSGAGNLFLDPNNQIQFSPAGPSPNAGSPSLGIPAAGQPAGISPQDQAYVQRLLSSKLFQQLVAPQSAPPAPAVNPFLVPSMPAATPAVAAPAVASPIPATTLVAPPAQSATTSIPQLPVDSSLLLPPLPQDQGSAYSDQLSQLMSPYAAAQLTQ